MFPFYVPTVLRRFTRVVFRLVVPGLALLALAVPLTYAQEGPLDNVVTLAESCKAPCFMGVSLGTMTPEAGVEQLRAHSLIQSVDLVPSNQYDVASNQYDVAFTSAASIPSARMLLLTEARTGQVEAIHLMKTGLRLADIEQSFGSPERFVLEDRLHLGLATYVAFYPEYQMYVHAVFAVCTPAGSRAADQPHEVVITVASPAKYAEAQDYYPADGQASDIDWAQQLDNLKQIDCE